VGKASSAKRVAKVAQSSSRTRVRGGQHLGFYSIVALVVLLGSLLVAYGRHTGSANASTPPIVFKDHWHAAYGIYACDKFLAPITNTEDFIPPNQDQTVGVHSHGDGVVHIHPFMSIASGRNAKLGVFFKVESIKASNTKFELPEGLGTFKNGDDCGGKPGTWKLAVWDDANATADPKIYITDFANVRFTKDRMAMTLAFVNSDTDLKTLKPPSIPQLDKLTDLGTDTTTATTAAGTATTVAGDTGSSTTVAGASTTVGAGATSTTLG
jgi:hypothetical protein